MQKKTKKPIPFFFITTSDEKELTYEKAYESLQIMKNRGFGGAILFNKPPTGFSPEEYLSEKWFRAIENFLKAGRELDLEMWINDGYDYPPGAVAGKVAAIDPTLCQYRICRVNGEIVPQKVDWGFPAFEHPRSSQLFHELVYEAYKKHIGKYFGNGLRGFFSDVDNRRVNAQVFLQKNSPMKDYFPWSEDFRRSFEEKFGYDIWPYMGDVLDRKDTDPCVDYWQHCGDLYGQWFANNYKWCRENGLEYTFHTSDTSPFGYDTMARSSAFTEGRFSDIERNSDYCGTDQELLEINGGKHYTADLYYVPEVSWGNPAGCRKSKDYYNVHGDTRTKQAQSTAFVYDKKGVMCEMFAASNFGATYEELREIAAFQIMQGVSFVVSHAYHHRSFGEIKYFAPPVFSPQYQMPCCAQFNGDLETYVSWNTRGELSAPIAVLDITEDLWRHRGDYNLFMDVCCQLNRQPRGFVIADKAGIERKKDAFSLIINTGVEQYETIAGIPVANVRSLEDLSAAIAPLPVDISWEGSGTPHYMVRKTDDGICALIANTENPEELTGTVHFSGKSYDVCLRTGEIAFFSEQEQVYRKPVSVAESTPLDNVCPVTWEKENVLPIARWENAAGKAVLQQEEDDTISFRFRIDSPVENLRLWVPSTCLPYISSITGISKAGGTEATCWDDPYTVYEIDAQMGEHVITIAKTAPLNWFDRIFLSGEFDIQIEAENPLYKCSLALYNLSVYIPEKARVTLSTRRKALDTTCSAAMQGHPFYSGNVTYHLDVTVPENYNEYRIAIPAACHDITIECGDLKKTMLYSPYAADCAKSGLCRVDVTATATPANFLEMYPRAFGITGGIRLEKIK